MNSRFEVPLSLAISFVSPLACLLPLVYVTALRTVPIAGHTVSLSPSSLLGRQFISFHYVQHSTNFHRSLILGGGLLLLPESPRWYVKTGKVDEARKALSRVRGQPMDSEYIKDEIAEIIANHEYETELTPNVTYLSSWAACFSGGIRNPGSNLRRTLLGITMQMMQQWTGVK